MSYRNEWRCLRHGRNASLIPNGEIWCATGIERREPCELQSVTAAFWCYAHGSSGPEHGICWRGVALHLAKQDCELNPVGVSG
jgi:hypothetical protein